MIPGGRSGVKAGEDCGIGRPERHEREQAEQRRRHSRDGEIGPLPPGFDAQMGAASGWPAACGPAFFREALRLWDAMSRSDGAPTSTWSSKK